MFWSKVDDYYVQCTEKYDDTFKEMNDNLFEEGYNGCFFLKEYTTTPEYLAKKKAYDEENEVQSLKEYLMKTDYVISKLNELRLEDETTYQIEAEKYKDVLAKRKEARARINEREMSSTHMDELGRKILAL